MLLPEPHFKLAWDTVTEDVPTHPERCRPSRETAPNSENLPANSLILKHAWDLGALDDFLNDHLCVGMSGLTGMRGNWSVSQDSGPGGASPSAGPDR